MKISYRAPGKIILSGEHAVVYTKPALVTAINLHLTCVVEEIKREKEFKKELKGAIENIEKIIIDYFIKKDIQYKRKPYSLRYESEIKKGSGMGSSAAFCVATVASLGHFFKSSPLSKEEINVLSYKAEKFFHGNPSGVDVSASCFGGLIYYRREFEFLKHISALNMKIPKNIEDRLVIIDTGKPTETTMEMVANVGKQFNKTPKRVENILNNIEKVTKRMVVAIAKEDVNLFADCIIKNQQALKKLNLVSLKTSNILKSLRGAGVGKVTGAGGAINNSGLLIFFIKDEEKFKKICLKESIKTIPFKQQFEGVVEVKI
jgi:mevalonate kinase